MLSLLNQYRQDRSNFEEMGEFPRQAAVLVTITDHATDPDIIFTKRARHLSQHGGEVSFPGGKWEPGDASLLETALRETEEEIGLLNTDVQLLNIEPRTLNRNGMKVTPYVGMISHQSRFQPCPEEIEAVFRVPVKYFFDDPRYRTDLYMLAGEELWSPAYRFEGFDIWGLTARILVGFLNRALQAGIQKQSDAPIRIRPRMPASNMIKE